MQSLAARVIQVIENFIKYSGIVFSYLILFFMCFMAYETILRYFFNSPTIWVHESCQLLFGVYALSLGAYALLYDTHVKMDLLYNKLSKRKKAILDIVTAPLFFFWIGLLLYYGGKYAWQSISFWERSVSAWSPPIWEVKLMVPVSALLILLQGVAILIRNILLATKGEID